VAEVLRSELGVECELARGQIGIFEVSVDGVVVAKKTLKDGFPSPERCVEVVRAALAAR
jgi:predicted Rdx family selenoprotein